LGDAGSFHGAALYQPAFTGVEVGLGHYVFEADDLAVAGIEGAAAFKVLGILIAAELDVLLVDLQIHEAADIVEGGGVAVGGEVAVTDGVDASEMSAFFAHRLEGLREELVQIGKGDLLLVGECSDILFVIARASGVVWGEIADGVEGLEIIVHVDDVLIFGEVVADGGAVLDTAEAAFYDLNVFGNDGPIGGHFFGGDEDLDHGVGNAVGV